MMNARKILYAGVAKINDTESKTAAWKIAAAFKIVAENGEERLAFCSGEQGLSQDKITEVGSIAAHFQLSSEEAAKGIAAINKVFCDVADHRVNLGVVPDWSELVYPRGLKDLYKPSLDV
jgi:hypothetical protein